MGRVAKIRSAVLIVLGSAIAAGACFAQSASLRLDQIVSRMERAKVVEREHRVPYTVEREYQLAPEGAAKPSSQVVAEVSWAPPDEKQYVIVKSEGNDRGIVRRVLDHEVAMTRDSEPTEISPANYNFALLGREAIEGIECYVLQLSPKRNSPELVRGKAWVDAANFQIRRIVGETAKSPSFLVKNVSLVVNYGEKNGVWMQTTTRAVADVRLAGPHVLTSRSLDVSTGTLDARFSDPAAQQRNRQRMADTAVWVAR
jgi:hypothetical protein